MSCFISLLVHVTGKLKLAKFTSRVNKDVIDFTNLC